MAVPKAVGSTTSGTHHDADLRHRTCRSSTARRRPARFTDGGGRMSLSSAWKEPSRVVLIRRWRSNGAGF